MKKKIYFLLPILVLALIFTSCNKDDDPEPTTAKIIVNTNVVDFGVIANVDVFLIDNITDNEIDTKITGSDGKVTFLNVTPGSYYIVGEYETNNGDLYDDESSVFSVSAGDERTINLVLEQF